MVRTTTWVEPLAVPPVMPPKEGDMVTLEAGVAKDISVVTCWDMVNWLEDVAAAPMAGSKSMKPRLRARKRLMKSLIAMIISRFVVFI